MSVKAEKRVNPLLNQEGWSAGIVKALELRTHFLLCHLPESRIFKIAAANLI